MSDVYADLGYGPAPTSARELLSRHREAVDPAPAATPIVARCHVCRRSVDVLRGLLAMHAKVGGGLCSGGGEVARG